MKVSILRKIWIKRGALINEQRKVKKKGRQRHHCTGEDPVKISGKAFSQHCDCHQL